MTDVKKLRELAEEATPGPWTCAGGIYVYSRDAMIADNNDETALVRARGVGGGMSREQQEANVEFISSANPQAIIELLDRLERYEKALRFYADEKSWRVTREDELHQAIMTIVGDVDSYGYQRDEWSPIILQIIAGKAAREALEGGK